MHYNFLLAFKNKTLCDCVTNIATETSIFFCEVKHVPSL